MNMSISEMIYQQIKSRVARFTIKSEKDVKRVIRALLHEAGVFTFMPAANAFGKSGTSDIVAVTYGITVYIETKYNGNTQTENQKKFERDVTSHGAEYYLVDEKNIVESTYRILAYFATNRNKIARANHEH